MGAPSPHFVLLPFMAQGHLIPMVDIAKLLAKRNSKVTILLTPHNANRVKPVIDRAVLSDGLAIRVVYLKFPAVEAGLKEGCESVDMISTNEDAFKFFIAIAIMKDQVQDLLQQLDPSPNCLIADFSFNWGSTVARSLQIPRIMFHGFCCFSLICYFVVTASQEYKDFASDFEYLELPNFPERIEMTKVQIRGTTSQLEYPRWVEIMEKMKQDQEDSFGTIVNTFQELEPEYIKLYQKLKGKKIWSVGPVSLCNSDESDKEQRGNKACLSKNQIFTWLHSQKPSSVIYVCLGSLAKLPTPQMVELALGLESSNRPFIWVIRDLTAEFKNWILDENYEERIKEQGLLIKGWAPQVLILSHSSIGCFFTHCGWNSSIEGIAAGIPLITWPVLGEQFCNEKLIVSVIKTGAKGGIEIPLGLEGEGEKVGGAVQVKRDEIKKVIEDVMNDEEEGRKRRERARELGKAAAMAVEEGGSSYANLTALIEDVTAFRLTTKGQKSDRSTSAV